MRALFKHRESVSIPCPEFMENGDAACRPPPIMSQVLMVGSCMLEGDMALTHRLPQELSPETSQTEAGQQTVSQK